MFYAGDPQHTPEARVTVEADGLSEHFYVHASCWNKRMAGPNTELSSERAAEPQQQKEADARRLLK
jgi:hypothetical protein